MRGDKNMGVFETIFRKPKADLKAEGYFKMLNGYTPVFSNAPESIYEMELTRAAIHSFASFASKLKPEISGTAQKNLERTLQFKPNPFMDTSKFIYRIATILSVNNTCFIVPAGGTFKVEVTNNPFDASPVWEDCTNAVVQGVAHVFTNKINTAAQYGMNIRVTVQRGDALTACWVSGIGGNFE